MSEHDLLQYLQRDQIDQEKWDACIDQSDNGLVYAYSFYLDEMASQWDALVLGDYSAVMPLPWNKKYGFYYLYQPFLCASLGVFGKDVTAGMLHLFLSSVPHKFRLWDMYLNYGNLFPMPGYDLYQRVSHVLDLNNSYEDLYGNIRTSYKSLFKRFDRLGYTIKKNIDIDSVLHLTKITLGSVADVKDQEYAKFTRLYNKMYTNQQAVNYGAYSVRGELMASGVFLFSHNRAYYIVAGNHPDGRTMGASHQVIHTFIKEHAGMNLLLDFEGSDVHNIAFFFKSFGAKEELYPGLFYNRLPPLLRWLKNR